MTAKTSYWFVGTWDLINCETSHPERPYPKSSVTTFAQEDGGIDYKSESSWSDGRRTVAQIPFKMDGSWCPVSGSAIADSASLQVLDDGSVEGNLRKGERESGRTRMTPSADGQTILMEWHIISPDGVIMTWKTTARRR